MEASIETFNEAGLNNTRIQDIADATASTMRYRRLTKK